MFPKEEVFKNVRLKNIVNPETQKPLELDIYIPSKKIAFEFHGRQHKTDEYQRFKDKIKRKRCKEIGILLFEVWTANLNIELFQKVKEECETFGVKTANPTAAYKKQFHEIGTEYKKTIYKMNERLNSKTFVRTKRKK